MQFRAIATATRREIRINLGCRNQDGICRAHATLLVSRSFASGDGGGGRTISRLASDRDSVWKDAADVGLKTRMGVAREPSGALSGVKIQRRGRNPVAPRAREKFLD